MIERIVEALMKWCERKSRVLKITGTAGPDDVYLIRYYVVRSRWMNVFIHQFLRSDRDDLHDHPWDFATYLVRGAYTERKWNAQLGLIEETRRSNRLIQRYLAASKRTLKPDRIASYPDVQNTFVFRRATDQHQVVVDRDLKESEKAQAALTLFVSGPTKREWGFIREIAAYAGKNKAVLERRWVPWREYLGLPPNTPGRG